MILPLADSKPLSSIVSFAVFLFFALMISVPRGYVAGGTLLLLSSFYFLAQRPKLMLSREDKALACLLLVVFLAGLLSFVYHGNSPRTLDLPTRYLLAIPVLLLVLHVPPRFSWVWAGLVIGCVSGAVTAYWQKYGLGIHRPQGFTGVIQFGDLGLIMGVFCVAGLFWASKQGRYKRYWQGALIAGALAGGFVSMMSGSRGGWVAIPLLMLLFFVAFLDRNNWQRATIAGVIICVGLATVAIKVPSIERRYNEAVADIQKYKMGEASTSLGARFALWDVLLMMIPQKPILGWGEEDYEAELERFVVHKKAHPVVSLLANTHNNYLELWALQGLVGLLSVLTLLLSACCFFGRRLRCTDITIRSMSVCAVALLISYGVFCMSQIMLGRNNTLLFFLMSLVVFWGGLRNQERLNLKAQQDRSE